MLDASNKRLIDESRKRLVSSRKTIDEHRTVLERSAQCFDAASVMLFGEPDTDQEQTNA